MRRISAIFLALALAVLLSAAACSSAVDGVETDTAHKSTITETVDAPASVTARSIALVSAPTGGSITSLLVKDGSRVRKGQIVAVIDSPEAQSRLQQARKALATVSGGGSSAGRVSVNTSGADSATAKSFQTAQSVAASISDPSYKAAFLAQISAAKAQYEAAKKQIQATVAAVNSGLSSLSRAVNSLSAAQRAQAAAAVDVAQAVVNSLTVKSPIAGTVQLGGVSSGQSGSLAALASSSLGSSAAASGVDAASIAAASGSTGGDAHAYDSGIAVGSVVSTGTTLLTIVDMASMGLVAQIDETDVLSVKTGTAADADIDAVAGGTYHATVRAVDLLPSPSDGGGVSYRARLVLEPGTLANGTQAPTPRPGMSAVVTLKIRSVQQAVAVPVSAVVRDSGDDAVWIVNGGKAALRRVTVGVRSNDEVQIISGIDDGQKIITTGLDKVKNGQKIP